MYNLIAVLPGKLYPILLGGKHKHNSGPKLHIIYLDNREKL